MGGSLTSKGNLGREEQQTPGEQITPTPLPSRQGGMRSAPSATAERPEVYPVKGGQRRSLLKPTPHSAGAAETFPSGVAKTSWGERGQTEGMGETEKKGHQDEYKILSLPRAP